MTASFSIFLALTGMTGFSVSLLALAMSRHHATACPSSTNFRGRGVRFAGWFFLAVSLLVALAAEDGGVALVGWFALLTAQAFAVTMLLTYAPRIVPWWTLVTALAACASATALFRHLP